MIIYWILKIYFCRFQIYSSLYSRFAQITIFYIICGTLVTFSIFFLSIDVGDILENFKAFNVKIAVVFVVRVGVKILFERQKILENVLAEFSVSRLHENHCSRKKWESEMSKFMSFQLDKYGEITDFAMKKRFFKTTTQIKKGNFHRPPS